MTEPGPWGRDPKQAAQEQIKARIGKLEERIREDQQIAEAASRIMFDLSFWGVEALSQTVKLKPDGTFDWSQITSHTPPGLDDNSHGALNMSEYHEEMMSDSVRAMAAKIQKRYPQIAFTFSESDDRTEFTYTVELKP